MDGPQTKSASALHAAQHMRLTAISGDLAYEMNFGRFVDTLYSGSNSIYRAFGPPRIEIQGESLASTMQTGRLPCPIL
jgi:hypothetical protein